MQLSDQQQDALKELEAGLARRGVCQKLNLIEGPDAFIFTEVDGVTVLIGPKGGFKVPALRPYPETGKPGELAKDAALDPNFFFKRQSRGKGFGTGHFHPTVDINWKCGNNTCPCQGEDDPLEGISASENTN